MVVVVLMMDFMKLMMGTSVMKMIFRCPEIDEEILLHTRWSQV